VRARRPEDVERAIAADLDPISVYRDRCVFRLISTSSTP
jgi:hypothetical protein